MRKEQTVEEPTRKDIVVVSASLDEADTLPAQERGTVAPALKYGNPPGRTKWEIRQNSRAFYSELQRRLMGLEKAGKLTVRDCIAIMQVEGRIGLSDDSTVLEAEVLQACNRVALEVIGEYVAPEKRLEAHRVWVAKLRDELRGNS